MEPDNIIASMAAAKLGPTKLAEGEAPAQEAAPAPSQQAQPQEQPTAQEAANEKVGAVDEGGQMNQQAVTFKVKFGDMERELTENQIASTFERYAKLNHMHQAEIAPMRPVLALAKAIQDEAVKNGKNVGPGEVAQLLAAATKAMIHNPQMGQAVSGNHPVDAWEAELGKWEQENAVSLPPKYKEAMRQMTGMQGQMQQMQSILQQMAGQARTVGESAKAELQDARTAQLDAIRGTIGTNLARAQQQFGLPDEAENDFMQFAMTRGYTMEDFVDPRLTMTVVQDFKNNMNSPEMERLRALTAKRQAFTGAPSGAPSGMSGMRGAAASADSAFFNQMVDAAVSRRS